MKKKRRDLDDMVMKNPVAKYAGRFNKQQVFKDRTKYCRKIKYRKPDQNPAELLAN